MPPQDRAAGETPTDWLLGRRAVPGRPQPLTLAIDAWKRAQSASETGDWAETEFWADRALRLGPRDTQVRFMLGMALLRQGKPRCFPVFQELAGLSDTLPAHRGLISAATLSQPVGEIGRLIGQFLSRFARPADPEFPGLAQDIAARLDLAGWCAANDRGEVTVTSDAIPRFLLDDRPVRGRLSQTGLCQLPSTWRVARHLSVMVGDRHLLGSPIDLVRHRLVEGFVAAEGAGLAGWAWHPANPDTPVTLRVETAEGQRLADPLRTAGPATYPDQDRLTAPQAFRLDGTAFMEFEGLVHLRDASGRDLTGSPLVPDQWGRSARSVAMGAGGGGRLTLPPHALLPLWADTPPPARPAPQRPARKTAGLAVIMPVYRGHETTLLCLDRLLCSVPQGTRIIVVDDASPEPDLATALDRLARSRRIQLIRNPENLGFPGSANRGMEAAGGRDVVLLNSDAMVPPGWLERLRDAAHAAPDIGTVAPLSNDATILSYPRARDLQPPPPESEIDRIDAFAWKANGAAVLDIPTSVGFCMYIRAACRAETGPFREDVFAQGYGEENDFCMRARHLGWRHVAAPGIFVAHIGGQSFRAARAHLLRRNQTILERMHPGYGALIAAHIAADPLADARRRLDRARWQAARRRSGARASVLLITHAEGGGVERQVRKRAQALVRQGLTPIILRPGEGGACQVTPGVEVGDPWADDFPNLTFRMPDELKPLAAFLRPEKPQHVELHHRLGHSHALLGLAPLLGIPMDVVVHDYAAICPRVTLVTVTGRYCGEPDAEQCTACVADLGSRLREEISVPDLRARTATDLAAARSVTFPSKEVESRFRRYVPTLASRITPWEADAHHLPRRSRPSPRGSGRPLRVAIIGAIGTEKGYDVILDCARDAARRVLPLEFVIVGYTHDDVRLIETGRVRITYRFAPEEAVAEIAAQQADIAFIPSIWPETWCFALSDAWAAGLRAAVFDIGTQSERVRHTGHGWVLPLALPAPGINNALMSLIQTAN
jgi:GT2 family glycosyltransferase/glycosyltransferase involved in cell wall biosynthesis